MKKTPAPIENLVYANKNSCKKELTVSSKGESVEPIFSSLVSQDNSLYSTIARHYLITLLIPGVCCTFRNVKRS